MPDQQYEVTIMTEDAGGHKVTKHIEYTSGEQTTDGASGELVRAIVQQRGNSRVREIDADR